MLRDFRRHLSVFFNCTFRKLAQYCQQRYDRGVLAPSRRNGKLAVHQGFSSTSGRHHSSNGRTETSRCHLFLIHIFASRSCHSYFLLLLFKTKGPQTQRKIKNTWCSSGLAATIGYIFFFVLLIRISDCCKKKAGWRYQKFRQIDPSVRLPL